MSSEAECPLCNGFGQEFYETGDGGARYFLCEHCDFIWLDPKFRLSKEQERLHYKTHNNDPSDPRYRAFLDRLWAPLKSRLSPGAKGLDYGSGPGPTLHLMAQEAGYLCDHYDPYFHPRRSALDRTYDFITCSETAEHFFEPAGEFKRLASRIRPGGWLGVMTSRYDASIDFALWHYRMDPTHVSFYSNRSFEYIADQCGFAPPILISKSVVLLQKI